MGGGGEEREAPAPAASLLTLGRTTLDKGDCPEVPSVVKEPLDKQPAEPELLPRGSLTGAAREPHAHTGSTALCFPTAQHTGPLRQHRKQFISSRLPWSAAPRKAPPPGPWTAEQESQLLHTALSSLCSSANSSSLHEEYPRLQKERKKCFNSKYVRPRPPILSPSTPHTDWAWARQRGRTQEGTSMVTATKEACVQAQALTFKPDQKTYLFTDDLKRPQRPH